MSRPTDTDNMDRLERYVLAALTGVMANARLVDAVINNTEGDPDKGNERLANLALNIGARTMRATARAALRAIEDEK